MVFDVVEDLCSFSSSFFEFISFPLSFTEEEKGTVLAEQGEGIGGREEEEEENLSLPLSLSGGSPGTARIPLAVFAVKKTCLRVSWISASRVDKAHSASSRAL